MLKIREDIKINELEKFGFKPKYDEDTGKITAYEKRKEKKEYLGLTVIAKTNISKIRIFRRTKTEWRISPYNEYFDVDTLYDLIRARISRKGGENMKEILFISTTVILIIIISITSMVGIYIVLTKINIKMGPYKCIDIDDNEIVCEQTWRSNGVLYGITKDGKTIDLKSYEKFKEE